MLRELLEGQGVHAAPDHHRRRTTRTQTEAIEVWGAREHNLKGVDVKVPRRKFTVMSGVSGSGKTSLALDTVYAEGQRRYCESLSSYARQFVNQMPKPKVDRVAGLSPGIAIEQRNASRTPRSTVGTETQIYDYMRVLFARLGTPHCPECGEALGARSVADVVDAILEKFGDRRILLLAPLRPSGAEEYVEIFARLTRESWTRIRVDGEVCDLPYQGHIDRRRRHRVELVVDRLEPRAGQRSRLAEAVERAFAISNGEVVAADPQAGNGADGELRMSRDYGCARCGTSYSELTPRALSFNHWEGWCPTCDGLGVQRGLDPQVMVPDGRLSIRQGAVSIWQELPTEGLLTRTLEALAASGGFSLDQPFDSLTQAQRRLVFEGSDRPLQVACGLRLRFAGLTPGIEEAAALSHRFRRRFARALGDLPCPSCHGGRLKPEAAAVRYMDRSIVEICRMPLEQARDFMHSVRLSPAEHAVAGEILQEIQTRLDFLVEVGLEYLNLHRAAPTLSGGEAQRVKLAGQLGSGLTGVMYVLDEPTVGIHPRDNDRMLEALERLRDLGNTVMVVEHDPQTFRHADHIIDFGPGAGPSGGQIVAAGSPAGLRRSRKSQTAALLRNDLAVPVPTNRRQLPSAQDGWLTIEGAEHNNLKNIDASIPLGTFVCVTGPSGSGKSSLIADILHEELSYRLHGRNTMPGHHRAIRGYERIANVISIDQSPIGHSPRSNAATYIGAFDAIRELFSLLPQSKARGYTTRRFSFNASGGRCEACWGMGYRVVEMHFLPDVWVECDVCKGRRYNPETLDIRYHGKNIADVLELSVDEALELFAELPRIVHMLQVLSDVGLGYLPLGQGAPTLSGGEAQRVKIARQLVRPANAHTLYLLDEPTTGLHVADIQKLLAVLNRLVDAGHTALLIEHNMDVVKTADYVIDLGPVGGDDGGYLVASGPPEQVAHCRTSATASYLAQAIEESPKQQREVHEGPVRRRQARISLEEAEDVQRPWETDGRRWHTKERVNERGESPAWHDEALVAFARTVAKLPAAPRAAWSHRIRVDFKADSAKGIFARVRTDRKWHLELQFRVPKGTFDEEDLAAQLSLPTWDEIDSLPIYGRRSRVRVGTWARGYDLVTVQAHFKADVTSKAFKAFLRRGWDAYRVAEGLVEVVPNG